MSYQTLCAVKLCAFNGFGYRVSGHLPHSEARKRLAAVAREKRKAGMDVRKLPRQLAYEVMWPDQGCSDLEGVLSIVPVIRIEC